MGNAVERSVRLLMLLAGNQAPATITEIAERLDTSVATASRLVQTLIDIGALRRDEDSGRLQIAVELAQLGAAALRPLEFRRLVLPTLAGALPDLQRPVNLAVPSVENGVWLESLKPDGRFISSTLMGVAIPYHAATMGKAMLAFLPKAQVERILSRPLHRFTHLTITDPEVLRSELAVIRDCGFAINRGEFRENGLAVAVPLIDASGRTVGAFSVPASQQELDPDGDLVRGLTQLGRSISQLLGYADDSPHYFV